MENNIFNNENNLVFGNKMEVAEFKAKMGIDRIDIIKNPHTGKLFFTYGKTIVDGVAKDKTGIVPLAGIPEDPVITEMLDDNGNIATYMLCKRGKSNVVQTL